MIVTNGKARLAARETAGREPAALLIHAGVTDSRSWAQLEEALANRCVSYDARGYGETSYEPEEAWSPTRDALAVLDAHGLDAAIAIGASMGGKAATGLALDHPERVLALVLIGAAFTGAPPLGELTSEIAALDAAGDEAQAEGDLDALNRIEAHLWLDGPASAEGRVGGATRELFLDMNGIALRAGDPGEADEGQDAWPRLEQIGVPTLVLVGELDLPHVVRNAREAAARIPGARLVELPGVAHLPHLEGDERTLREIADLVDTIIRAR